MLAWSLDIDNGILDGILARFGGWSGVKSLSFVTSASIMNDSIVVSSPIGLSYHECNTVRAQDPDMPPYPYFEPNATHPIPPANDGCTSLDN